MNNENIKIRREKDGGFIAFLKEYPPEYEKPPYKIYAWTGAKNEEEAIKGIKSIYPELFKEEDGK